MRFREIWDRLTRLFGRSIEERDMIEKTPVEKKTPRKWWEFPFKRILTAMGGLDMPKSQTCPKCGARAKRREKTASGARYSCRCKAVFFVKASKGQLREKRKTQRATRPKGEKRSAKTPQV